MPLLYQVIHALADANLVIGQDGTKLLRVRRRIQENDPGRAFFHSRNLLVLKLPDCQDPIYFLGAGATVTLILRIILHNHGLHPVFKTAAFHAPLQVQVIGILPCVLGIRHLHNPYPKMGLLGLLGGAVLAGIVNPARRFQNHLPGILCYV